jgi:hypothetical protein
MPLSVPHLHVRPHSGAALLALNVLPLFGFW